MFVHSYLYQIAHLGDDDDEPEFSSAMPLEEGDTFFFAPRPLRNLVLVDEMDSLSPILACQVADLGLYILILIVSLVFFQRLLWWLYFNQNIYNDGNNNELFNPDVASINQTCLFENYP